MLPLVPSFLVVTVGIDLGDVYAGILIELLLADIAKAVILILEAKFIEHNAIGLVIINQRLDLIVKIIPDIRIHRTKIAGIATCIGTGHLQPASIDLGIVRQGTCQAGISHEGSLSLGDGTDLARVISLRNNWNLQSCRNIDLQTVFVSRFYQNFDLVPGSVDGYGADVCSLERVKDRRLPIPLHIALFNPAVSISSLDQFRKDQHRRNFGLIILRPDCQGRGGNGCMPIVCTNQNHILYFALYPSCQGCVLCYTKQSIGYKCYE